MENTVHNNGNICSEVEQNGITAHMQVFSTEIDGAKVDPVGMLYKEETINGVTGRMPVVAIEGSSATPTPSAHNDLTGRDANGCHPISAITGNAWLQPVKGILSSIEEGRNIEIDPLNPKVSLESPTTRPSSILNTSGIPITVDSNFGPQYVNPMQQVTLPAGIGNIFVSTQLGSVKQGVIWENVWTLNNNYPPNQPDGTSYLAYDLKSIKQFSKGVWSTFPSLIGYTVRNLGEPGYPMYHYELSGYVKD